MTGLGSEIQLICCEKLDDHTRCIFISQGSKIWGNCQKWKCFTLFTLSYISGTSSSDFLVEFRNTRSGVFQKMMGLVQPSSMPKAKNVQLNQGCCRRSSKMKRGENMKTRESTSRATKVQRSLNSLWLFIILMKDQPFKIYHEKFD